jgi:polyribonucleotide nucleotidyltransferase
MMMQPLRVECELDGKVLILETGQVARQAGGAIIARMGDTMVSPPFAPPTPGKTWISSL